LDITLGLHLDLTLQNGFAEVSKNLATDFRYRSENNFIELSKQLCRTLKLIARMLKLFAALLVMLEFPTLF